MADIFILISFCIGVLLSEAGQWAKWQRKHHTWVGYWEDQGVAHLILNAGIDASVYCLWTVGLLDTAVNLIVGLVPGMPDAYLTHGDLIVCPQVALALGFGTDLFADRAAYTLKHLRLPWLSLTTKEVKP
jgi:hypothetical protein